jgi:hypothetical protein
MNIEQKFTQIWESNSWSPLDSGAPKSGCGSTLVYTENVRQKLPKLIERLNIGSVLDAPCGDFNWMQAVRFPDGVTYIGGDIVLPLIRDLRTKYPLKAFLHVDVTSDRLPDVDLLLCRDCLIHFSYVDIAKTLSNFLRSKIKYLLTTSYSSCANRDIITGDFRSIDLLALPFEFDAPGEQIDDWIGGFPPRALFLWERERIGASIGRFLDRIDLVPGRQCPDTWSAA